MQVLHICQRDDIATGGAARVAVELVKRLPVHGVSAKCVFVYGEAGEFGEELGEQAIYLGFNSAQEAVARITALKSLIAQQRYQLVHHHDGLTWTHWVTKRMGEITRFGHAHLSPPISSAPWRAKFAGFLHRRTYHHLVCVSESTRRDWILGGFPACRASVIPNGVDAQRFRLPNQEERMTVRAQWNIPAQSFVIGYVGRLHSAMKGCEDFLKIIAELPSNYLGVLAGTGPDESSLRALAVTLKIESRICFLGLVDVATAAYWGFDMFLMVSRYEAFGLVLLEAGACGVPSVVLPAEGGLMDLARSIGAKILSSRDPKAAACAILQCNNTDGECQAVLLRDQINNKYSWDLAAEALADSYRLALANHSHGR